MSLSQLEQWLGENVQTNLPPVESWHPQHCGDIDIVIRRDGSWWHEGQEIRRRPLVRMFSRILRLDDDEYVLVTPVEKMRIQVEDTPFMAVLGDYQGGVLRIMTQTGDEVEVGPEHPMSLKPIDLDSTTELFPVVEIRRGLQARIGRNLYYQLAEHALEKDGRFVLASHGQDWPLA